MTTQIIHCIECDAIVTGRDDHGSGFARCPAHQRKLELSFAADPVAPKCIGRKTKTWLNHQQAMHNTLIGGLERYYLREIDAEPYGNYWRSRVRDYANVAPIIWRACR